MKLIFKITLLIFSLLIMASAVEVKILKTSFASERWDKATEKDGIGLY